MAMIYLNVQMNYCPEKQGEIVRAKRKDNGEWVSGECFFWTGRFFRFIICESHHERVSQGHIVDAFSIEKI